MPRFAPLGAIASMQALWTAASPELQQLYRDLLGAERADRSYPFRSLRNAGAMLAGGSDWSVSTMNPLAIMQTGVTHIPIEQPELAPWNPDERLDLQTMLEAHTVNAAYALRFDDCTGSLEAGKDASFAILDRNPFRHPVDQVAQARVIETCFRGEVVYAKEER
jgi:predicted amidohydrolase YtcJ